MVGKSPSILIAGAGPVGLTAALELKRRGFAPQIIDAGEGPHLESRALGINPRTLDILEASGASAKLLAAGTKVRSVNIYAPAGQLARIEMRNMPHRRDYMLVLPQTETEKILVDMLGGMKQVEWSTRLTDLTLKGEKPEATIEKGGRRTHLSPDIVIGADGAHSTTRKAMGIGFSGAAYEHDWGLADVRVDGLTPEELHLFDHSPVLVGFIPIRADLFRAVADHPDVLEFVPGHVTIKAVEWKSQFRISHRQVETYQRGPVFLAGDAAHIHSPLGGRGMNLGIEDAAWLAYLIERGETENFTALRHPVAQRVIDQVDAATRFMSSENAFTTFLRRHIAPLAIRRDAVQRNALRQMGGLAVAPPPWLS